MQLFLIRHAIAEDGADDFSRPLSARGTRRFTRVVKGLQAAGVRFDLLLHSPKVRAVQTAELAAGLVDGQTQLTPWLAEAPGPRLLAQLHGARVAVVGHQPWLGELVSWLVLNDPSRGAAFVFKKGAVALLEGEPAPGRMQLAGLWGPALLRRRRP